MGMQRAARLAALIADVEKRWGRDTLVPLSQSLSQPSRVIASGYPALDNLLAGGGFPTGQLTELAGPFSSGMMTLVYHVLAQASSVVRRTAYLDLAHGFDGDYAARCGVALDRLLVVRPIDVREAFDIASDLVDQYGAHLMVIDTSLLLPAEIQRAVISTAFRRLLALTRRSACAVLMLVRLDSGSQRSGLHLHAALSLLLERQRWIERHGLVYGCDTQVTVLKQTAGLSGRQVVLRLPFPAVS